MDEAPESRAATSMMQYLAVMATIAEAAAQVAEMRARERAARDAQQAAALRAALRTRYAKDKLTWEPVLDPRRAVSVTEQEAAQAWTTARSWPDDDIAVRAAEAAEQVARRHAPDLMRHYDMLRSEGQDPVVAMSQATRAMSEYRANDPTPQQHRGPRPGDPGVRRPVLVTGAMVATEHAEPEPVNLAEFRTASDLASERYERSLGELSVQEATAITDELTADAPTAAAATTKTSTIQATRSNR